MLVSNTMKILLTTATLLCSASLFGIDVLDSFSDGLEPGLWNDTTQGGSPLPSVVGDGNPGASYTVTANGLSLSSTGYDNVTRNATLIGSELIAPLNSDWQIQVSASITDPSSTIANQLGVGETVALSLGVQNFNNVLEDFGIELSFDGTEHSVFTDAGFEFEPGDFDGVSAVVANSSLFIGFIYNAAQQELTAAYGDTSIGNTLFTYSTENWGNQFATIALQGFAEADFAISDGVAWGTYSATGLAVPEPAQTPAFAGIVMLLATMRMKRKR
jgi:hypothetical protein